MDERARRYLLAGELEDLPYQSVGGSVGGEWGGRTPRGEHPTLGAGSGAASCPGGVGEMR
jgi:hypothetical protein